MERMEKLNKISTRRKKDKVGFWNVKALRQKHYEVDGRKEGDICECGHPRYMHYKSLYDKKYGFCKVHGCREKFSNNNCKKFKKNIGEK